MYRRLLVAAVVFGISIIMALGSPRDVIQAATTQSTVIDRLAGQDRYQNS